MKTVNLIYYNNGVGLSKDSLIIKVTWSCLFEFYDFDAYRTDCPEADINIFLQNIDENTVKFIPKAKTNILIPNLEWMVKYSRDHIRRMDFVFAKSRYCKSLLDQYHPNVIYTGFTSINRYEPTVEKTKEFLHFSGKSVQKYTELVVDVFSELNLPITIVDSTERFKGKTPPNITYIPHFLSEKEVNEVFNSHKFHICCSISEGWGHYIYEALSSKAVVMINDCSPENELLTKDTVFMIKTTDIPCVPNPHFLKDDLYPFRKLNYSDRNSYIKTIRNLTYMPESQIKKMGESSRDAYLNIDNQFRERFQAVSSLIV